MVRKKWGLALAFAAGFLLFLYSNNAAFSENWVYLKGVAGIYDSAESIFDLTNDTQPTPLPIQATGHLDGIQAFYSADYASALTTFSQLNDERPQDTLYDLLLVETGRKLQASEIVNRSLEQLAKQSIPTASYGEKYLKQHAANEKAHLFVKQAYDCIQAKDLVCFQSKHQALEQIAPSHWAGLLLTYLAHDQLLAADPLAFSTVVAQSAWYDDDNLLIYVGDAVNIAIAAGEIDYLYLSKLVDLLAWHNGMAHSVTFVDRLLLLHPNNPYLLAMRGSLALRNDQPELAWIHQKLALQLDSETDWQSHLCCFAIDQMACAEISVESKEYLDCVSRAYQSSAVDVVNELQQLLDVSVDELSVGGNLIMNGAFSAELDRTSWYFNNWTTLDTNTDLKGSTFSGGIDRWDGLEQENLRISNFSQQSNDRAAYYYYSHVDTSVEKITLLPETCYALSFNYKMNQQRDTATGYVLILSTGSEVHLVDEDLPAKGYAWSDAIFIFCNNASAETAIDILIGNNTTGDMWIDNVALNQILQPNYQIIAR